MTAPVVLHGLDEVRASVGLDLGPTEWIEITTSRLDAWAQACPGTPVAYLLLSLTNLFMPEMLTVEDVSAGLNIGTGPVLMVPDAVLPGTRVRGSGRVVSADEVKPGAVQTVIAIDVHIEGNPTPSLTVQAISRWLE